MAKKKPAKAAKFIPCRMMSLPDNLLAAAAATACAENPENHPERWAQPAQLAVLPPLAIAALTSRMWSAQPQVFSVSFMEACPVDLRDRILEHMNLWSKSCGKSYQWTAGQGDVRISRGRGGYYSYIGSDNKHIPLNQNTMNLEAFTMQTPLSEFRRVPTHETGHHLGFVHEAPRKAIRDNIDPAKAYAYFQRTQGWSRQDVDQQVLTSPSESELTSTPVDRVSIMCYALPAQIMRDGVAVPGGAVINDQDYAFAASQYPKAGTPPVPPVPPTPPTPPPAGQLRATVTVNPTTGQWAIAPV